jgi:hypothetical protein
LAAPAEAVCPAPAVWPAAPADEDSPCRPHTNCQNRHAGRSLLPDPPMSMVCRFIAFEELRKKIEQSSDLLEYLKPEFVQSFSESCEGEDF